MVDIKTLESELAGLGVKLETARTRRQKHLTELRAVMVRAELTNDRKVVAEQGPLNKLVAADQVLLNQLERQIKDTTRQLDLARAQSACAASRAAAAVPGPEKRRWFDVRTPRGAIVRHKHASLDALRRELQSGYVAVAEVFGCDDDGIGGFPVAVGQRKQLLEALHAMSEA